MTNEKQDTEEDTRPLDEIEFSWELEETSALELQAYLNRGRALERFSLDTLKHSLVKAYQNWARNPLGASEIEAVSDVEAEYKLRGLAVPRDEVRLESGLISEAAKKLYESADEEERRSLDASIRDRYEKAKKKRH